MSILGWLVHGHPGWASWQWALWLAGWCVQGAIIGWLAARLVRRHRPFDTRHVRQRCLHKGHRWERIPGVPIQFCRRYGCMGARVAPFIFEGSFPPDLVAELEQKLDQNAASVAGPAPLSVVGVAVSLFTHRGEDGPTLE